MPTSGPNSGRGDRQPSVDPVRAPLEDTRRKQRAAQFLGMSVRTLDRYVTERKIPCIIYENGERPMIVFDPADLAAWRDQRKLGRH